MSGIYFAAVAGDPLSTGSGSYVENHFRGNSTIEGPDGVLRDMTLIGDDAYCSVCNSVGQVIGGAPIAHDRRIYFQQYGRWQAVGEDLVACKCPESPRIIATYGCNWRIIDLPSAPFAGNQTPERSLSALSRATYDERVMLEDAQSGKPLANVPYRIVSGSRVLVSGVTDAQGRTQRVETEGVHALELYVQGI
jgi:hypothetical protein